MTYDASMRMGPIGVNLWRSGPMLLKPNASPSNATAVTRWLAQRTLLVVLLCGPSAAVPSAAAAPWWTHAVIYEIYVRSFQDSDGDGIGDLNGVAQRLDYLQTLGVDAIWLTPFYPSPNADFGYDVADYTNVASEYGTMADWDALVSAANKRGMRI
jgi:hypothetical protein